jgi:hypothetical protein
MAGIFRAEEAKFYWIDGSGKKLVYKNVCTVCDGAVKYAVGISGSSFGQITEQLKALKVLLVGPPDPRKLNTLLASAEQGLQRVSYDLGATVAQRRTRYIPKLEASMRGLEDSAQRRMAKATAQFSQCRALFERGDAKSAALACDAALASVGQTRAALDTAQTWLE